MERGEGDAVAGHGPGGDALGEYQELVAAAEDERQRGRGAGAAAEEHAVDRFALAAHQADVERRRAEHESGGDRVRAERPEHRAGHDAAGDRRPPGVPEVGVERLEVVRRGHDGEEDGDDDEGEDRVGHCWIGWRRK